MQIVNRVVAGKSVKVMNHSGIKLCFDRAEVSDQARLVYLYRSNEFIGTVFEKYFDSFLFAYSASFIPPVACSPGKGAPATQGALA